MCTSTPVLRDVMHPHRVGLFDNEVWRQSVAQRLSLEMSDMARRGVSVQDIAHPLNS